MKDFIQKVYRVVAKIPEGKVMSYGEVARRAGHPGAARAVGSAMNKNPDTEYAPCHRVVCSDGSIGGYAWGVRQKIKILAREGVDVKNNKVGKSFLIG